MIYSARFLPHILFWQLGSKLMMKFRPRSEPRNMSYLCRLNHQELGRLLIHRSVSYAADVKTELMIHLRGCTCQLYLHEISNDVQYLQVQQNLPQKLFVMQMMKSLSLLSSLSLISLLLLLLMLMSTLTLSALSSLVSHLSSMPLWVRWSLSFLSTQLESVACAS